MADEQKPAGAGPAQSPGEAPGQTEKPAAKPTPKPAAAAHAAPPKPPATMAATPWDSELSRQLKERFGEEITECSTYLGQNFVVAKPEAVAPVIEFLKMEEDFDYLVDVTAVDYPKRTPRFDLIYILYSFSRNERIRVKTAVADGARPQSVTGIHLTANWLEREVFDMFGIQFEGHPDLRRILMPDEWQGYPLRKDYSILKQDESWVRENLGIESGQ